MQRLPEVQTLIHFFEQAPTPMALLEGPTHRFLFINEIYRNLFCGGRDFTGLTLAEALPETVEQGFVALLDQVYQTGQTHRGFETPVILRDGPDSTPREFILNFVYQAMRDSSGAIRGISVVAEDRTDSVRVRQHLNNQRLWLRNVLDRMPLGLIMMEKGSAQIQFANRAASEMVGFSLLQTDSRERSAKVAVTDRNGRALKSEEFPSARASRGEEIRDEEFRLETPKGTVHIMVAAETLAAAHDQPETALLVYQDVTPLRKSEEQFRLFTELAPQMPFIADVTGAIVYFSPQWYQYIGGLPGTEGWGWRDLPVHHPDDLDRAIATWSHSIRTGAPYQIEYRLRRYDGEYRWHLGRATPVRDERGQVTKWFGTNVDIHDQKLLELELREAKEQAEVANQAKSNFLANMSHEIRTPLGAILGFAELLRGENLSEEGRQFLNIIERNGQSLSRLIDDILDLSKVEAGQMLMEALPFSMRDLIQDTVTLFTEQARTRGLQMRFLKPEQAPGLLESDPARIRQVLNNLIGNAVKFTLQGEIEIWAEQEVNDFDPHLIRVHVRDTGVGMTEAKAAKLFEPFVQADASMSRKFGGTGLGLALSRRLARALGGNVFLERTEPDRGSHFVFEFRARPAAPAPRVASLLERDSTFPGQRLRGWRILAVDDSPDNRSLLKLMLRAEGADVVLAESGADALEKNSQQNFRVILMDIQMPEMDGYDCLRELKRSHPNVPVLALTAHALAEERRRTEEAGFVGHVTKPIEKEILIQEILRVADSRAFPLR